jgi:putative multicomponent Na+:H+ antiporter subunit B
MDIFMVALLPLAALFTVLQTQPYFALVSRGILGAVAVMLYAVMGAADVALTEALVGTLLTVILYVVAVRSSLVLRIGRLAGQDDLPPEHPVRLFCARYTLSLKTRVYSNERELATALREGWVDAAQVSSMLLDRLMPQAGAGCESGRSVTLLAEHGRWHESKMKAMFPEQQPVIRLSGQQKKGAS